MKISVITTIRNEQNSIGLFIESLLVQTKQPDEIIITDGDSTDRTAEIVQSFIDRGAPVRFIVVPGNRSIGRNRAVQEATSEIVACTDAGVKLDRTWVEQITVPLLENPNLDVVSGFSAPDTDTSFEESVAIINLPLVEEINADKFLPSSRSVAFRKSAWQKAGGYPEWLNLNEDTPFNFRMVAAGCKFKFNPAAVVYWRPTGNFTSLFKQFRNYARGDGQSGMYTFEYYVLQKYLVYGSGLLLSISAVFQSALWYLLLALVGAYFWLFLRKGLRRKASLKALVILVPIVLTRDLAEIIGFTQGYWERLRHPEIYKRK